VLSWSITTRTSLQDGLYRYDAIARLQDASLLKSQFNSEQGENNKDISKYKQDIGKYITLGALGTAFLPSKLPRVLLIDEIDKSDINLPNDLLNIFEEGEFQIPELVRANESPKDKNSENQDNNPESKKDLFTVNTQDKGIPADIKEGWVRCDTFPIIVMTSNEEKDFPPAFKRRCIRIKMPEPSQEQLKNIVEAHFGDNNEQDWEKAKSTINRLIGEFSQKSSKRATDQLLNSIYLLTRKVTIPEKDQKSIEQFLLEDLNK
jgi:MoxR-like ATPase